MANRGESRGGVTKSGYGKEEIEKHKCFQNLNLQNLAIYGITGTKLAKSKG